ncbi:ferritin-like domain-containing protein [Inquilinus sp. KBS0705]|nr:ferritin-like domain-containing protein [Inquilinus sp. KBS0705]
MKTEINQITGGANMARRSFLRYAGASAATVAVLGAASCKKDKVVIVDGTVDLGKGDIGILNYAYALEQLEAAFYLAVVANPYSGITAMETTYLTDIRDHEVLHRDFFKAALGSNAIPKLEFDLSSVDLSNRTQVLATAKLLEDTGVKAYDGAGYLIESADYLTIAGKIVSVEARHAALIANLITPGSFVASDNVDANGLNASLSIAEVLTAASPFFKTKISARSFNYIP